MTWPLTSIAIRKAHRLDLSGQSVKAARLLDKIIETGSADARVGLLGAIITPSDEKLQSLSDQYPENGAIALRFALTLFNKGAISHAQRVIKSALDRNKDNISLQTLHAIIKVKQTLNWGHLISTKNMIQMSIIKIQAIALMEIEKKIAEIDKADNGANEKGEGMGGWARWFFARLDNLAVWIYWLLRIAFNSVRFITDFRQMKIGRYQIEAEKLEGLGLAKEGADYRIKVLALDSEEQEALRALLLYHLELEDFINVQKYLAELQRIDPDSFEENSYIKAIEAETLFSQNNYIDALEKYAGAQGDYADSHIIAYKKGLCQLRLGYDAKAIEEFETALKLPNENLIEQRVEKLASLIGKSHSRIVAGST